MKTAVLSHPVFLKHDAGPGHPERADRLQAILARLRDGDLSTVLEFAEPAARADVHEWIGKVHSAELVERVRRTVPQKGYGTLDADTMVSPHSLEAAEMAVGCALDAVDRVVSRRNGNVFCCLRPPGHHAEREKSMGFCLFNNVAVAAYYAREKYGFSRLLIVDWDVHHGNGTQDIFYEDSSVLYFSSHEYPLYPGSGSEWERGTGAGEGFTLNCPLPAGAGDVEIVECYRKKLIPAVNKFRPEFVLISAGFDAHRKDPLANLNVTESGFAELTKIVKGVASDFAGGRIVSVLEGGYDLEALAASAEEHLRILSH